MGGDVGVTRRMESGRTRVKNDRGVKRRSEGRRDMTGTGRRMARLWLKGNRRNKRG